MFNISPYTLITNWFHLLFTISVFIPFTGERERDADRERERDTMFRLRERQYSGSRRWLETALRDSGGSDKSNENVGTPEKKRDISSESNPFWLSDELEFWPEKVSWLECIFLICYFNVKLSSLYTGSYVCRMLLCKVHYFV